MTLIANALACERNGRVVFSSVSFALEPGQCAELRGPNGAGKSSLLRLIAGLVPKSAGTLTFDSSDDIATQLHFIAHQEALKSAMSVSENLHFWCDVLGGSNIDAALAAFNLETLRNDPVQLLSAGQRRRLSLSRLFLASRPIWLLDEPMTALDAASKNVLREHIKAYLKSGGSIIAATHGDLGLLPDHVVTLGTA
jgi:heme exporter protein A